MNKKFLLLLAPIILYTLVFPPLLVGSFGFALSVYMGGEYIMGSLYFELMTCLVMGYAGVVSFTRLMRVRAAWNELAAKKGS